MKASVFFFCVFLALFSTINVQAQKDFGLWTGIDGKLILSKQIQLGAVVQMRFKDNVNLRSESFISPYLTYDPFKHFKIGLDYRFSNNWDDGYISENRHRITLDLGFKKLLGLFNIKSRFNFNSRLRYVGESRIGDVNSHYLRGRIKLSYNLPKTKIEPHISSELFYHFNDQFSFTDNQVIANHRFNKYRFRAGLAIPVAKQHLIRVFYIIQKEIGGPKTDYIGGLTYRFRWKL